MIWPYLIQTRRQFLQSLTFCTVAFVATGSLADELVLTPRQTEGPFYPDVLPKDTDNDLVLINESTNRAAGEITHLRGRVFDRTGKPVQNAVVEIWQVDGNGVYLHTRSPDQDRRDKNFQGFGRTVTGLDGGYYFRTIKPTSYMFGIRRAPHIHLIVRKADKRMLTSQLYIKGHVLNEKDIVLQSIQDEAAREAVLVDFKPIKGSKTVELAASFDIVIGETPEDLSDDIFQSRDGRTVDIDPASKR
jgi:protocatechuate 3,4-dioxygenase beta subunit